MAAFATVDDFADYYGIPVPTGAEATELAGRLTRASGRVLTLLRQLGGRVTFDPATGLPVTTTPDDQAKARALKEATCAQAQQMAASGESADGTPFAGGTFGPLTLNAADGGTPGSDPRFSIDAREILVAARLRSTKVRG